MSNPTSLTTNVHLSDPASVSVGPLKVDHSLTGPVEYVRVSLGGGCCIIATQEAAVALFDRLSAFLDDRTHADFGPKLAGAPDATDAFRGVRATGDA